eukprot:COSAG04_NODE_4228_length_2222_cov_1.087612_4_plen_98_part_00
MIGDFNCDGQEEQLSAAQQAAHDKGLQSGSKAWELGARPLISAAEHEQHVEDLVSKGLLERGQADEIKGALSANLTDELREAERAMDERDDKVYLRL